MSVHGQYCDSIGMLVYVVITDQQSVGGNVSPWPVLIFKANIIHRLNFQKIVQNEVYAKTGSTNFC